MNVVAQQSGCMSPMEGECVEQEKNWGTRESFLRLDSFKTASSSGLRSGEFADSGSDYFSSELSSSEEYDSACCINEYEKWVGKECRAINYRDNIFYEAVVLECHSCDDFSVRFKKGGRVQTDTKRNDIQVTLPTERNEEQKTKSKSILGSLGSKVRRRSSRRKSQTDMLSEWFIAALTNNVNEISRLIHTDLDVDTRDEAGKTALLIACENGHKETTKRLLQAGAMDSRAFICATPGTQALLKSYGWSKFGTDTTAYKAKGLQIKFKGAYDDVLKGKRKHTWHRSVLVICGGRGSGKTSLVRSLQEFGHDKSVEPTLGVEYHNLEIPSWQVLPKRQTHFKEFVHRAAANSMDHCPGNQRKAGSRKSSIRALTKAMKVKRSAVPVPEYDAFSIERMKAETVHSRPKLSTLVMDFSGNHAYDMMKKSFFVDRAVYVITFDMERLLSKEYGSSTLQELERCTENVMLCAPNGSVAFAGTHCEDNANIAKVNDTLVNLIKSSKPKLLANGELAFFPVSNIDKSGCDTLKQKLELALEANINNYDPVSVSAITFLDELLNPKIPYLSMSRIHKLAKELRVPKGEVEPLLERFIELGLIVRLKTLCGTETNIVFTQKRKLVDCITLFIFDEVGHVSRETEAFFTEMSLLDAFKAMCTRGFASEQLVQSFLGTPYAEFTFRHLKDALLITEMGPSCIIPHLLPEQKVELSDSTVTCWIEFPHMAKEFFQTIMCSFLNLSLGKIRSTQLSKNVARLCVGSSPFTVFVQDDHHVHFVFEKATKEIPQMIRLIMELAKQIAQRIFRGKHLSLILVSEEDPFNFKNYLQVQENQLKGFDIFFPSL